LAGKLAAGPKKELERYAFCKAEGPSLFLSDENISKKTARRPFLEDRRRGWSTNSMTKKEVCSHEDV